jgi:hypothetical protein
MSTIIMKGWPKYFQSIQDVCPWSYQAYKEGKLDIREFDIDAIIDEDWDWTGRLNAIVWQNVPYSLNDLEALVTDFGPRDNSTRQRAVDKSTEIDEGP